MQIAATQWTGDVPWTKWNLQQTHAVMSAFAFSKTVNSLSYKQISKYWKYLYVRHNWPRTIIKYGNTAKRAWVKMIRSCDINTTLCKFSSPMNGNHFLVPLEQERLISNRHNITGWQTQFNSLCLVRMAAVLNQRMNDTSMWLIPQYEYETIRIPILMQTSTSLFK